MYIHIMLKGNTKLGGMYGMSLFVTSRCNQWCKECIMHGLMKKDRRYEMSIEELIAFIDITERSAYKFHYMLTGGEPLIWKNLEEGVKLLRQSSSCNYLYLFTNLINHEAIEGVIEYLDCVKVSQYTTNEEQIHKVKKKYGRKVKVFDRTKFWVNPKEKIDISTPVTCMNEGELMFQDYHVYACLHSASIAVAHKDTETAIRKPLELNYLDGLDEIRTNQAKNICSLCTSNKEIRDMMSKPEHESQFRILI